MGGQCELLFYSLLVRGPQNAAGATVWFDIGADSNRGIGVAAWKQLPRRFIQNAGRASAVIPPYQTGRVDLTFTVAV